MAENETVFVSDDKGNTRSLSEIEKEIIVSAILRHAGKMTEVARRLKIGRSTLYRKLKKMGLI